MLRKSSPASRRWTSLARQLPVLPFAILVPFIFIALFADWIAPYDPTDLIPGENLRATVLDAGWQMTIHG